MKTIALYSIKGGVGKTAAAVNLAYFAAQEGFQTLLCDLDPQGSTSFYFRIRPAKKYNSVKFLRGGEKLAGYIKGTDYAHLDLLPADFSFRNLDIALHEMKKPRKKFGKILSPFDREYEYLFLDCPPNITLASENVFRAADLICVPLIPTTLSLLAFEKLIEFIKTSKINRKKIYVFFSMVEKRKKLHRESIARFKENNPRVFLTKIPYSTDIEKMGVHREPAACSKPKSAAADSYRQLWREIKNL
ncbi:MAG TPA: ParA family protein [Bacteroidetes bacterium]|nr:ParA family protein [Bacteroidota bacterium]